MDHINNTISNSFPILACSFIAVEPCSPTNT
jgi:hypothetical protein